MPVLDFYLFDYLPQAPLVPLWLLGIVLAVRYRRREPRVSRTAGVGLGVILAVSLARSGLFLWMPRQVDSPPALRDLVLSGIALVNMVGWLLLLGAVFGRREPPATARRAPVEPVSDARALVRGAVLGASCGGVLMFALWVQAPFYLAFFQTAGAMVTFGIGWGTFVGATAAVTGGMGRGAVLGAAAGFVLVLVGAAAAGPEMAGRVLTSVPLAVFVGAALGAGVARGWRVFARKRG